MILTHETSHLQINKSNILIENISFSFKLSKMYILYLAQKHFIITIFIHTYILNKLPNIFDMIF